MADSDKFGSLGERARTTSGKNGNGRAHDLSSGQTRPSTATPRSQESGNASGVKVAAPTVQAQVEVKTKEEILLGLAGKLPEPSKEEKSLKEATVSAEGLTKALYNMIKTAFLTRWTLFSRALLAAKKSSAPEEIRSIVEKQNSAIIKADMVAIPSATGRLFANFLLCLIELREFINGRNVIAPADFRSALTDILAASGVLMDHRAQPDIPKALSAYVWDYTKLSGEHHWCSINPNLAFVDPDDLKEMRGLIDDLFMKSEKARAAETAASKGRPVVDTDTTKPVEAAPSAEVEVAKRLGVLSLSELLEGNLGVSRWLKVSGGGMRLHTFLDPKGKFVVGVEVHERHKAFSQIPGSIGVKIQAVTEALESGEDPDFTWATKVGKKFEADLKVVWPWVRNTIAVLKAKEAADAAEEKAAIALAAKAKEAKPVTEEAPAVQEQVVENAGTEPAPEATADTKETGFALVAPAITDESASAESTSAA